MVWRKACARCSRSSVHAVSCSSCSSLLGRVASKYKPTSSTTQLKGRTAAEAKPEPKGADPTDGSAIRQVVCAGPVTVVSKDQVASGDNAVFDRVANRVVLTGNVVLSQCQNVTRGSRLVYDMNTGRANMDPVAGGRVSAMFVPGGKDDSAKGKQHSKQPKDVAKKAAAARKASHKTGSRDGGPTKAELMQKARAKNIPGRSTMSKGELERALNA